MSETEKDHDKILKTAKECFKAACDAESKQRKREIEDLRFQVPEFQWTDEAKAARSGGVSGAQVTPPRPILSISLINQPIQLVYNQAAAADLGVNIHPVSEKASKETADIKQGLYRRIERDSGAEQVRLWALDRAEKCGRGWYRITTQYDEDGDNEFDQEIVLKRILYQDSVYMDPSAQESDCRDANWAFQVSWVPLEDFKREYPDSKAAKDEAGSDSKWMEQEAPEWTKGTGDQRSVLVAEYWRKVKSRSTLYALEDGTVSDNKMEGQEYKTTRVKDKVTLCWYKITGFEVLDEQELDVRWIPLVPVYGRELQPFDGERRFEGMIRPAMDGQRLYNFAASTLVERMALEPKTPFIGVEGQFAGHENEWQQINARNFPYVEYRKVDLNGTPAPPPQRAQIDQTGMSLAMMALQEGKGFVQSTTAVYDPSLGETPKHGQSGRAVIAQQQQSDAGTSNYLQNLANISMPYEALVVIDWMPHVYDRPGRVVQILGAEDEEKSVVLNAPFVPGEDGRPMPIPPGMVPPDGVKHYDLSAGKYSTSVSIGKSYQTRLQQGAETMGQLLQGLPPEGQILLLPIYLKFLDTPGASDAAEIMKKYRDKHFPGIGDDEKQGPTTQQLQSQMEAMQQKGQEQAQQLQMAVEQIKTEQAKQMATIEKAKIEAAKEIRLQEMRDATSIAVAEINARAKGVLSAQEARHEALATGLDQAHELGMMTLEQQHAKEMATIPPPPDGGTPSVE